MVSGDRGPAVVGLRRSVIVMPAWVSELDGALLRLVFLHEREHQRAGDQRLFAAGLLACVAMAWNPIVWWQFRRLRLAIEYDCDRRVLSRGASRREYAEALLTVGRRTLASPLGATAFAERRSAVERRLRRMTAPLGRLRGARAALAGGLGALALALACGSPLPTAPGSGGAPDVPDAGSSVAPADRPASGPYDTPPARKNRAEPLIIVDGVVQGPGSRYRNVADLRALDIDRVEVIKGAAAERIYGTRGADGVIHITTKKH